MAESDVKVSRKMSVLEYKGKPKRSVGNPPLFDHVFFNGEVYEQGRPKVLMTEEQYVEIGSPESITVAIYPGDRQDLMEQEDFPA